MMRTIYNLNDAEQIALTITPAVCSLVSFLGSGTILYTFARDYYSKKNTGSTTTIKHRILAAICLSDLINSTWYAFWSLPIPETSPGVWGAMGNTATCDAQGLFLHLGNVGAAYNGALAIYFLLSLRYGMKDEAIAKKYELYMHLWGLIWPLATGLVALSLELFNFGGVGCWIAPYPYQCHLDDNVPCTRGERAYLYAWTFTGAPLAITNIIIIVCMILTYRSVRESYQRAQRPIERALDSGYLPEGDAEASRRRYAEKIKQAGLQAFLYSAAYFLTHMWAFVVVITEQAGGNLYFFVLFLQQFFWPLQGFCNVFIYLLPTILQVQRRDPSVSFLRAAYFAAFHEREQGWPSRDGSSRHIMSSRKSGTFGRFSSFFAEGSDKERTTPNTGTDDVSRENDDSGVIEPFGDA